MSPSLVNWLMARSESTSFDKVRGRAMRVLTVFFRILVIALGLFFLPPVQARDTAVPEAVVTFANRDIVTLRTSAQGATPELRSKRISDRLRQLDDADLAKPLSRTNVTVDGRKGQVFLIGDRQIFILYEADLDADEKLNLDEAANRIEEKLKEAIAVSLETTYGATLLKGVVKSLITSAVAIGLLLLIQRATRLLLDRLQIRLGVARGDSRLRWAGQLWLLIFRMAQLVMAFLWISVAYLWGMIVLGSFPLTQPFAEKLSGFLLKLIYELGAGAVAALPGMVTVAIVLFLTKAVNDVVSNVFNNVQQGISVIPGVHRDTADATRRIVGVLIWGFGIAVAYPYLPLAESEAFKGLSVMFGFMLTLGSAGVVTQMMSGLVLIYSRALKVGDFVSIGDVMGVVKETGVLSTKIINMRNEEVTIPNAVLVGNSIKNFTSGSNEGAMVSTTVTIGYDTPWRQVHAMLINAAEKTGGLRKTPKPFVLQKSLQDFYVEYELFIQLDKPLHRVLILSELHGLIQDEFNTHGVQIMSPHFVLQPKNNVVVDKENWFVDPANKP